MHSQEARERHGYGGHALFNWLYLVLSYFSRLLVDSEGKLEEGHQGTNKKPNFSGLF